MANLTLKGANYIAGDPSIEGDHNFYGINPPTLEKGKVKIYEATRNEIDLACKQATNAFTELQQKSRQDLAKFLRFAAEELMALGDILLETAHWETNLGIPRFTGERGRMCTQLDLFADYIEDGTYLEKIIDEKDPQMVLKRMLIPIGPVGVFGASNFPLAFGICGGDTASAWAAGCPVVAKGHQNHPQTSELITIAINKAIRRANFPKGMFSLLQGEQYQVGQNLVMHPNIRAIGFTGSFGGGKALYDIGVQRPIPIPIYSEMGSVNPVFITPKVLENRIEETAQQIAESLTVGMGQFCTKPGIIFVCSPDAVLFEQFIQKISQKLQATPKNALLSQNITNSLTQKVKASSQIKGVKLITGGNPDKAVNTFENTLLSTDFATFIDNPRLAEEHFGPMGICILCNDLSQFTKGISSLEGQLSGTFHFEPEETGTIQPYFEMLSQKVGRILVNGVPTGVTVSPAMQHGGPYPATTAPWSTSVGMTAVKRFLRPICYQNVPTELLPEDFRHN